MFYLRQGATHKVLIGPVVAVGNGFTPVTTLALTTADEAEALVHDSATVVDISGYTFAAVTTADGYYVLTLQSGISGTVGHMTVLINDDSLCLPVKAEFTVVEEVVYDAFYAASATGVPAAGALEATSQSILTDTGTTLDGKLDTIDNFLDTEVAAILAAVDTEVASILSDTNAILIDTAEIGTAGAGLTALATQVSVNDLPTNAELATALGTADDAVLAAIAALNDLSAAEVNAEIVDALATDAYAESGQGAPAATATLAVKIGYLYKAWRNRSTQSTTQQSFYNDDAATVDHKATVSDDGVTFNKGEVATGP